MSGLSKNSTIPSVASTSQEGQENRTLKVTLLSTEWESSTDGDLSTINRELAIQLAKHPNVNVSVLLPKCSDEDRSSAKSYNVKLIEAERVPGFEPGLWLSFPPRNHTMDCVIGHGVHLGRHVTPIKRNPNCSHCKWIQVVHSAPEEVGMYKNTSEGEQMQQTEIELCKMADQVITIGPKLADVYTRYLCRGKQQQNVFDLTPSIFSEFLEVKQATEEIRTFCVLVIGSGDSHEDFNVKGYDIAAEAIAELKDESYKLRFVCAPGGKGDEIAEKLLHHGISRNQLIVRRFNDKREVLANFFCEVDLAIMPSRTEGFGITALKALSAGLPILVSSNSGLGEALKKVPLGSYSVVDSEDPKDWARAIKLVHQKEREVRLSESKILREKYLAKYSWEEPCKSVVIKMRNLVFGGNERVIHSLQQWQQNASRCKISSSTDLLADLHKIASARGYRISDNQGSGNCMFYALSEQLEIVKGDKIHHLELRHSLVQYLREHPKQVDGTDLFHFVERHTTWGGYLTDMEQDGTWGDHLILWAAANCYRIPIHVISSLSNNSDIIINPDSPLDKNKHLLLGHVHEVHYVSLQPLQGLSEIRTTTGIPHGRFKRPVSVSADQPHKQLRKELSYHDHCKGFNSYGFPAPSTVDYRNPPATVVNPSNQESQTFRQGFIRHDQLPSLVNQSQPSPQVPTWTHQDPTYHSNHTQVSSGSTWPSSSVGNRHVPSQVATPLPTEPSYETHGYTKSEPLFPVRDKRPSSIIVADQPSKRLTAELSYYAHKGNTRHSLHQHDYHHFREAISPQGELDSQRSGCKDNEIALFRRLLSAEYNRRSLLKPLFWLNTFKLALKDVYTRLSIISRRKTDFMSEGDEVDVFDIFRTLNKGEDAMVLVEGSPGIGKTTFCLKISHDWANGAFPNESFFSLFELLLLLKCRDIYGDVIEAIVDQLLPEDIDQNTTKKVVHYIMDIHNQERILIILDGLDELPKAAESFVDKLLRRRILPFCYLLVTSRQEKGIVVRQNVEFDVLLQIKGFTEADSHKYIRKHFSHFGHDHESKGESLIQAIEKNSYLHELPSNPLNLLLLCVVFEVYEGSLPSYRTDLYQIIVRCLLRRYCAKRDLKGPADDKALMNLFEDSLLVLGELAWRCLREYRYSFREEELAEFESANANLAARELGLVFKEASLRKINPQHEYFFFHKTFQEYLAAFYLANGLLKKEVDLPESIFFFHLDMSERYRQVFIFISGILGENAGFLFEQIGKNLKEGDWDWYLCREEEATFFTECFKESRSYERVAMAFCSFIPFPQTMTIDLSDEDTSIAFFSILEACGGFSQFQLPVHLAIECSSRDVFVNLDGDTLADIIASNTKLQALSFSGCLSGKEITTLLCKALRVDSTLHSFTLQTFEWISSSEIVAISDSLAANKTLTTVTFKLPGESLNSWLATLDEGLSADTPLTSVVLEIFCSRRDIFSEDFKKILLNRSLTSLSLTLFGDMDDSLTTSISEGLVASPSLKSLALMFCGKLSYTGMALLKNGFLGNRSLESLELKVFGELPTNWANILRTLHPAVKATTSFTVYPNVTGMVGTSQVACLCPVLKENLLASKLHSLAVNIWGELDCSGANDLCKGLIASTVSCITLNFMERVTDSVANCLFKHLNKLSTLSELSISIQGELMGDGKNTLERLSHNQMYLFALNVHDSNSGNKICREVGLSADDSSSLVPVFTKVKDGCITKLSVNINNPKSISGDWGCSLREGLAKSKSLTMVSLIFKCSVNVKNMDALWGAMAENTSLTTLSLTFNDWNHLLRDMTNGQSDGVAKKTSLTTLSLTLNNYSELIISRHVPDVLSDCFAKNTSLTTLNLTINNCSGSYENCVRINVLGKNTSLTTLSFTLNHYQNNNFLENETVVLIDSLAKNMSLTLNNYSYLNGCIVYLLSGSSVRNMSLTTLSLTLNNYGNLNGKVIYELNDGLGESMSLTTLNLTLNNYSDLNGDVIYHLEDGLAKNTSLTMLSLTVNNYSHLNGDLTIDLSDGLGNNKSLTTLSLTLNSYSYMPFNCFYGLKNALAENTSLITLTLTLNNCKNLHEDWIDELADALAQNTSLSTISLELNIFSEGNLNTKSSSV